MKKAPGSIRNKLMVACALVVAAGFATPAAMAHDSYRGHDHSGEVIGALVVGAVIGGVIASASHHDHDYYNNGYYSQSYYPQQGYYESAPAYSYGNGYYNSYPAYSYPSYGSGVSVGVVYNSGRRYGRDSNRGDYRGSYGHYDNRGYNGYRGDQGHYYSRHGH